VNAGVEIGLLKCYINSSHSSSITANNSKLQGEQRGKQKSEQSIKAVSPWLNY